MLNLAARMSSERDIPVQVPRLDPMALYDLRGVVELVNRSNVDAMES